MKRCEAEEKIDLYLKGKLSDSEIAGFEDHYFNCPACFQKMKERAEIMAVIQRRGAYIFSSAGERRLEPRVSLWGRAAAWLTPRQWVAAAVSAALLLVVVLGVVPRLTRHAPEFALTEEETIRGESLVVLSPFGETKAVPAAFEWKGVAGASEYQLTLTSGVEVVWRTSSREARVALPLDVKTALKAGVRYSWQVKAYSAQGTLLASSSKVAFNFSY